MGFANLLFLTAVWYGAIKAKTLESRPSSGAHPLAATKEDE